MNMIDLSNNDWIDVNELVDDADTDFEPDMFEDEELGINEVMEFYYKKYGRHTIAK